MAETEALSRESVIDQITVDEAGNVSVRRADRILEGGEVISVRYHRHVLAPGDDLSGEDPRVVTIAEAAWAGRPG